MTNRINKVSDIHRERARVIDLCEGTGVRYQDCVRFMGRKCDFDLESVDGMSFALAIVEGVPVFAGDTVWDTYSKRYVVIVGLSGNPEYVMQRAVANNVKISDLLLAEPEPIYPYTELRVAQNSGKVVLFDVRDDNSYWEDARANGGKFEFIHPLTRYRIMDTDMVEAFECTSKINGSFKIEVTTSHITCKKTVKIIDNK